MILYIWTRKLEVLEMDVHVFVSKEVVSKYGKLQHDTSHKSWYEAKPLKIEFTVLRS